MGDNYEVRQTGIARRRKQESQWEQDFIVFLHRDVSSGLRDDDDEITTKFGLRKNASSA